MSRLLVKKVAPHTEKDHSQSQHTTLILIQTFSHSDFFTTDTDLHLMNHLKKINPLIWIYSIWEFYNTFTQTHISHILQYIETIYEWTVLEIVNKEGFLWAEAGCENVEENKERREEKKLSERMWNHNVLTMLSLSSYVLTLISKFSCNLCFLL